MHSVSDAYNHRRLGALVPWRVGQPLPGRGRMALLLVMLFLVFLARIGLEPSSRVLSSAGGPRLAAPAQRDSLAATRAEGEVVGREAGPPRSIAFPGRSEEPRDVGTPRVPESNRDRAESRAAPSTSPVLPPPLESPDGVSTPPADEPKKGDSDSWDMPLDFAARDQGSGLDPGPRESTPPLQPDATPRDDDWLSSPVQPPVTPLENPPVDPAVNPPVNPPDAILQNTLTQLDDRLQQIGRLLAGSLDTSVTGPLQFSLDAQDPEPRSYRAPTGAITVTAPLVRALTHDAWLAAVLAYEIGESVRLRSGEDAGKLDAFVLQLLKKAGYDPYIVKEMGEWILGQTSISSKQPTQEELERFSDRIQNTARELFPEP